MTYLLSSILTINYFLIPGIVIAIFSSIRYLDRKLLIIFLLGSSIIIVNLSTFLAFFIFYNSIYYVLLFELILILTVIELLKSDINLTKRISSLKLESLSIHPLLILISGLIVYVAYYFSINFFKLHHDELFQIFIPGNILFHEGKINLEPLTNYTNAHSITIVEQDGHRGPFFNYVGTLYFFVATHGNDIFIRLQHFIFYICCLLTVLVYCTCHFKNLQNASLLVALTFPPLVFLSHIFQFEIAVFFFGYTSLIFLYLSKNIQSYGLAVISGMFGLAAVLSKEMSLVFFILVTYYLITEKEFRKNNLLYLFVFSLGFIYYFHIGAGNQINEAQATGDEFSLIYLPLKILEMVQFFFNNLSFYDTHGFGILISIFTPIGIIIFFKLKNYAARELNILIVITLISSIAYYLSHNITSEVMWFGSHSVTLHMALIISASYSIVFIYKNISKLKYEKYLFFMIIALGVVFNSEIITHGSGKNIHIVNNLMQGKRIVMQPLTGKETFNLVNPNYLDFHNYIDELTSSKILVASHMLTAPMLSHKRVIPLGSRKIDEILDAKKYEDFIKGLKSKNIKYIAITPNTEEYWKTYTKFKPNIRVLMEKIDNKNEFKLVYNKNKYKIFSIKN